MLHEVGKVLRSSFRESDVLGRVGGDEFLLLLKNIDLEVALDKLEQVKRQLAAVKVGPHLRPRPLGSFATSVIPIASANR